MSGSLELYRECREHGIKPIPGVEAYLVKTYGKEEERYHCGLLALDYTGYKALVRLSNDSFSREHFYRKPRIDLKTLYRFGDEVGKHVALLSGCFFGLIIQEYLQVGETYAGWYIEEFKKHFPNFYIEVQMHNTVHPDGSTDWDLANWLRSAAHMFGLPLIATQDSHYCQIRDKSSHEMMKKLGYMTSDESEFLFPGNSYHLAKTEWVEKQYMGQREMWSEMQSSFRRLLYDCHVEMPALDKYKFNVPEMSISPNRRLSKLVYATYDDWANGGEEYGERVEYELDIIAQMGFANYFLLMHEVIGWCKKQGIVTNTRGSANGSLVCYLLGITQVDPMEWGISFDRFLHPTRKKPPDIDVDVEPDRRPEIIAHLAKRWEVTGIGTFGKMTDANDRGSVFVKYLAYKRRSLGEKFRESEMAAVKNLWELDQLVPDDAATLRRLAGMQVFTGGGQHAAGYLLSSLDYPLEDYIPTMLVGGSKVGHYVTQMTMDDCESAGFVKADFLGVSALSTVAAVLRMIGKDPVDGLMWIPNDDKLACKEISNGRTGTGVFQFEGYSTAVGARMMKIAHTKDAILCLALTRPAALSTGADKEYLAFRKKEKTPKYIHPIFEKYTSESYGVFIIQDQVIDILRALGMSFEDLNDMLKAVKASNEKIIAARKTFERIEKVFRQLCKKAGMYDDTATQAWAKIRGFSDYGFNRAHATAYGLLGYRMGYLKAYWPKEFMCATLQTWAGTTNEAKYIHEARSMGLHIHRATVESDVNWTMTDDGLRKGLLSVKGIGVALAQKVITAREDSPFQDEADLRKRCGKVVGDALADTIEL
jgi:DNA polymerase-3 subunit alpha